MEDSPSQRQPNPRSAGWKSLSLWLALADTTSCEARGGVVIWNGGLMADPKQNSERSKSAGRAGSGRREAAWGEVSDWLDDWIAIEPDGRITAFSGKVELGTGVRTAMAQIVA